MFFISFEYLVRFASLRDAALSPRLKKNRKIKTEGHFSMRGCESKFEFIV